MKHWPWSISLLLLLLAPGAGWPAEPPSPPAMRLLVPAYFYPDGAGLKHWDRLIAAAARAPVTAIVNPASGPGDKADPSYSRVVEQAKKAGVTLIGYVSTRYGKRPLADVKANVDRWGQLYPEVAGIFFDEQASAADHVAYYAALYQYARKERRREPVVTNPGTVCAEGYVSRPASDAACFFEADKGFGDFRLPAWADRYAASRFAALAYKIGTAEQMRKHVEAAARQRVGYFFVTDAAGKNPWDRLPVYWDEEVAAVQALNKRKSP